MEQEGLEQFQRSNQREYKGIMAKVVSIIAVTMSLYHIFFITHSFERFGFYILLPPFLGGSLGFFLVLVFLLFPAKKDQTKNRLPWYDKFFIFLSAAASFYVLFMGTKMAEHAALPKLNSIDLITGTVLIILVLEAVRRVLGPILALISIGFIIQTMFSNYLPISFRGRGFPWESIVKQLFLWDTGLFNIPMQVAATTIFAFVLFSSFMDLSGAGKLFVGLALSLFGRFRGGPAKVSVLSSALFGMISGSTSANVVVDGVINIPMMKKVGYKPHVAGAIEAVTSNGGQLMPPVMGAVAFVIPEFLGISYASVCLAALFPAIFYFVSLFIMVDLEARKTGLRPLSKDEVPSFKEIILKEWWNFIPIVALIYFLMVLLYEAEYSALGALAVLLIISLIKKKDRLDLKKIIRGLELSSRGMIEVGIGCAAAGIIIGCVGLSGLGQKLSMGLIEIAGGNLLILLLLTAISCFILGMGMTTLPIYIMLVVLVSPALVKMNVLPIAAHLFIFYWGLTSFITPPVCIAAFVAAAIAGSNPFQTGWSATKIGIATFTIPFIFVYGPGLLLKGTIGDVIGSIITCTISIISFCIGIEGYIFWPISRLERILFFIGGLSFIFQDWRTNLLGFILLGAGALTQIKKYKLYRNESVKV